MDFFGYYPRIAAPMTWTFTALCKSRPVAGLMRKHRFMSCIHLIPFLIPGISWPSVAGIPTGIATRACGHLYSRAGLLSCWVGPGQVLPMTNFYLIALFFHPVLIFELLIAPPPLDLKKSMCKNSFFSLHSYNCFKLQLWCISGNRLSYCIVSITWRIDIHTSFSISSIMLLFV